VRDSILAEGLAEVAALNAEKIPNGPNRLRVRIKRKIVVFLRANDYCKVMARHFSGVRKMDNRATSQLMAAVQACIWPLKPASLQEYKHKK